MGGAGKGREILKKKQVMPEGENGDRKILRREGAVRVMMHSWVRGGAKCEALYLGELGMSEQARGENGKGFVGGKKGGVL